MQSVSTPDQGRGWPGYEAKQRDRADSGVENRILNRGLAN